ncbi:MAG: MFS transporter [Candidatus Korobacteraceae bacterium]
MGTSLSKDVSPSRQQAVWRAVIAGSIGNVMEWYDFAVYAYLAVILGRHFFPTQDETIRLLSTFAVFGVGFVARPIGGFLIGLYGDKHGRKPALLLTIMMMAVGTALIGVLPTYATIGMAAPVLLVLARLMQGFSAGGEWGGAASFIVEWAPAGRRGFFGGFQTSSILFGSVVGSCVTALLSTVLGPAGMNSWGWRVPFLLGSLIGPLGVYARRKIDETPVFEEVVVQHKEIDVPKITTPLGLIMLHIFFFAGMQSIATYLFASYFPTYSQKFIGLSPSQALWSTTIAVLGFSMMCLVSGWLSDIFGRKKVMLTSCAGFLFLTYPLLSAALHARSFGVVLLVQTTLCVFIGVFNGTMPATLVEAFPTGRRYMGLSTAYNVSSMVFGGFGPFIATWLIARTGAPISLAFLMIAVAAITTPAVALLRETAFDKRLR